MADLKVLIVDDEKLIRNLLKMRINWEEFGMEIVGEASGSKEALEMVESLKPDIIFTDVCMPVMSGIELSKAVAEKYPNIKIVIITGHDRFDYAKTSIKLGVFDYLLKPINGEEIRRVAEKLREKIKQERSHKNEFMNLKLQLDENLSYIREKFFNELLQVEMSRKEIQEKLSSLKLDMKPDTDTYQSAVVEISNSTENNEEDLKNFCFEQVVSLAENINKDSYCVNIFKDNSNKLVILSNSDSFDMEDFCGKLKTRIIKKYKCFACIGIGNKGQGIQKVKESYNQACEALNYKLIRGKNQIINYEEIVAENDNKWEIGSEQIEKLTFCVKSGLEDKAHGLVEEMFSDFCYNRHNTIVRVRMVLIGVLSACQQVIMENGKAAGDLKEFSSIDYDYISILDNVPDIKSYLKKYISNIILAVKKSSAKMTNRLIEQIKEYIQQNMHSSKLSLSSVAREFYISPGHLSRLFKQETNQTFVNYVTKIRMNKAMELLKETDLKVYQVGEKVGIDDPHYFSIIFKKFTGISVNKFRKINRSH